MEYLALGRTDLLVSKTAFGAMSLSDLPDNETSARLVQQAYEGGINFFDTSHTSTESERRLGDAIHVSRSDVIIATKSAALSVQDLRLDLDESLKNLQTDYIDLYQLENPSVIPVAGGEDGFYDALAALKSSGKIRYVGIATQQMEIAEAELASGSLWETLQFPFNMLCEHDTESFVKRCAEASRGFIAMQPLCGGVLTNIPLAIGYLNQFENAVPVWGARSNEELQQILYFTENPPVIDERFKEESEKVRAFFN
jgi:uncharacterized protein